MGFSLTPALSPRRGRIFGRLTNTWAGDGRALVRDAGSVLVLFPLLGERVRVRASLITN